MRENNPELRTKLLSTTRRNLTGAEICDFLACCVESFAGRVAPSGEDLLPFLWDGMVIDLQQNACELALFTRGMNCLSAQQSKLNGGGKNERAAGKRKLLAGGELVMMSWALYK